VTFVDTSGWYATYVKRDENHAAAVHWWNACPTGLVTTDYVVDETITLMMARGERAMALMFGVALFNSKVATIHYLRPSEIAAGWAIFQRFADKAWSFTDCTSKAFIESQGISHAFSFDHHFRQFGSVSVVP
jgi:uncharacterized protein